MRYQGSEAYSVRAAERAWERTSQQSRSSFEVVSGGGLDARVRQGVSHEFLARFRAVLLVAAFFLALNLVRVAISAATVSVLQANADLTTQISEAETLNSNLRIERSVLSSNARISRIATQNYGMVLPSERLTVDLDATAASQGDAADEGGQAASDGEAAQPADATGGNAAVD